MPGFELEQATEEVGELLVRQTVPQEAKPLTRPCFNEPRHQQPVHGPLRLLFAHEVIELPAVTAGTELAEGYAASLQDAQHHVKVGQLLLNDLGHRPAK